MRIFDEYSSSLLSISDEDFVRGALDEFSCEDVIDVELEDKVFSIGCSIEEAEDESAGDDMFDDSDDDELEDSIEEFSRDNDDEEVEGAT